jgi:hypothetical protein
MLFKDCLTTLKAKALGVWLKVPFGTICKFQYGALTVTVKKNFWLIMDDGHSKDALPITFVSQELVTAVSAEMLRKGYSLA